MSLSKTKFTVRQLILFLFLVILFLSIDLTVKFIILHTLGMTNNTIRLLPFLQLVFVLNRGISFSFLYGANWLGIILMSFIALILGTIFMLSCYKNNSLIKIISLALLCGGGLGNIIDRLINKSVVDFIYLSYNGYSFPVFNLADCFINISLLLLLYETFLRKGCISAKK